MNYGGFFSVDSIEMGFDQRRGKICVYCAISVRRDKPVSFCVVQYLINQRLSIKRSWIAYNDGKSTYHRQVERRRLPMIPSFERNAMPAAFNFVMPHGSTET